MINQLLDRCIVHRPEMLDAMKKRKEVFGARTKPPEEDLLRSLLWAENNVEKACALQNLQRNEDNLVTRRPLTRAQVRYALRVRGDEENGVFPTWRRRSAQRRLRRRAARPGPRLPHAAGDRAAAGAR